jgi:hypothetical protein
MGKNSKNDVYSMPDPFVSDEEKLSYRYGLQVGKYIEHQELLSETYINHKETWLENEAFMKGIQSTDRLKKILLDGDKSYAKYDFTPLPIIPKFINSIKANLNISLFYPKVTAVDPRSKKEREAELKKIKKNRYNGKTREGFSKLMGVEIKPNGFNPADADEEELYMKTEYRQKQEVAMEQAIKTVLKTNRYETIRDQLLDDVLKTGRCVLKVDYDPVFGIKIEWIDSIRYVNSIDTSGLKDVRDSFYHGHVKLISYTELATIYGLDKAELVAHYNNGVVSSRRIPMEKWDDISSTTVEMLFFEFKTVMSPTYRKKYGRNGKESFTLARKDSDYISPAENIEVVVGEDVVWMEGAYVVGSDMLAFYRKRDWQTYTALKEKLPSYHVFETQQMPMTRRMIPVAEKAHLNLIKLDQMIAEARPKGLAINESALADIVEKDGGEPMSFLELTEMYNDRGTIIYRQDQFSGAGLPITELENGLPRDTMTFLNLYNARIQDLYFMSGMNPIATGAAPQERVSTDSNKIALNSSIQSIEFIKDALIANDRGVEYRLYEDIIYRIINIDKFDEVNYKDMIKDIASNDMDELMSLKDFKDFKFVFDIQSEPDIQEIEDQKNDIAIALQTGQITLSDKIELNNIKSPKLGSLMLKTRIKQNAEKAKKDQMEINEANQKAGQAEREAKIAFEAQLQKLKDDGVINKIREEHLAKMEEIKLQGDIDMRIAGVKGATQSQTLDKQAQNKQALQNSMEDRKDQRDKSQQQFIRSERQMKEGI